MSSDSPRTIFDKDLSGARFNQVLLTGAVLRGVDVGGVEIDSPWLCEGGNTLMVNGIDVAPLVDAELNRRLPGREQRRANTPYGLRAAWAALKQTWDTTLERASTMPDGTVDVSVDGEWSFAQTLRHLVMATDTWLGKAVLQRDQPYHPLGLPDTSYAADGGDLTVFVSQPPTYEEVLSARADRVAMVADFLAAVTLEDLAGERPNPHDPRHAETVLSCLHTILEEEWEHHRYAVRDLDALAAQA